MIATDKDWRPFEPSREAVEQAQREEERAAQEEREIYLRALRNGMPPSGRWA
jgi:lysyl-tRNA synthetase class II